MLPTLVISRDRGAATTEAMLRLVTRTLAQHADGLPVSVLGCMLFPGARDATEATHAVLRVAADRHMVVLQDGWARLP